MKYLLLFLPIFAFGQVHPTYQGLFSGGEFTVMEKGGSCTVQWTKCPEFNYTYLNKTQAENFSFDLEYYIGGGYGLKKFYGKGEIYAIEPVSFPFTGDIVIVTVCVKPKGKWYGAGDGQEYWLQKKFWFVGSKKHGLYNLGQ